MLSIGARQWRALESQDRTRARLAWIEWLKIDFPDRLAGRDLEMFVRELEAAAIEIGATSSADIYRVMALSFLPGSITNDTRLAHAIGRALVDVEVPIGDRLRFIDQLITPHTPWPASQRAA